MDLYHNIDAWTQATLVATHGAAAGVGVFVGLLLAFKEKDSPMDYVLTITLDNNVRAAFGPLSHTAAVNVQRNSRHVLNSYRDDHEEVVGRMAVEVSPADMVHCEHVAVGLGRINSAIRRTIHGEEA